MRPLTHLYKLAALAAFAMPGLASANELLRVYQLAVQNDAQIQAAMYQRDASLQARPQARSAILPQVSGGYTLGRSHSESDSGARVDPDTGAILSGDTSDTDSTQLSVSLNQTVFDWAAFKRLAQAGDQVALAQASYRAAEQTLVLRSAQAYFNVLAAADSLRFTRSENKAVERQLEQAQRRFDVGLSAITDVQEAQARYDLTVAQVLQAEQVLTNAKQALTEITNTPDVDVNFLQDEIPLPGPDPFEVGAWVAAAEENNLDLQTYRLSSEIARKDIGIARAGHYPTLGLRGSYSDSDSVTESSPVTPPDDGRSESGNQSRSIGLSLSVPIFSGFLVKSQVAQAESTFAQRKAEQESSRRSVERQVRDAYLGVISGAAQVRALKQAVVSATTALEASETGFQVGTRTSVDVLNAQRDLYSAQRDYAQSRYDYLLSVLTLKQAAGRLSEPDIAEIDRLLVSG